MTTCEARQLQISNAQQKLKATEFQRARDEMVACAYKELIKILQKPAINQTAVENAFVKKIDFLERKYGLGVHAAGREAGFALRNAQLL